jgi:hypothetical protein
MVAPISVLSALKFCLGSPYANLLARINTLLQNLPTLPSTLHSNTDIHTAFTKHQLHLRINSYLHHLIIFSTHSITSAITSPSIQLQHEAKRQGQSPSIQEQRYSSQSSKRQEYPSSNQSSRHRIPSRKARSKAKLLANSGALKFLGDEEEAGE